MNLEFYYNEGIIEFKDNKNIEKRNQLIDLLMNPRELKPNEKKIIVYSKIKKYLGFGVKGKFNFEDVHDLKNGLECGILVDWTNYKCSTSEFLLRIG